MASDGVEIDLYAEDLENEFNQDQDYNESGADLYDDVITGSGTSKHDQNDDDYPNSDDNTNSHSNNDHHLTSSSTGDSHGPTKKIGIYVGNLTWWTTDQDIVEAINRIGITDVIEVKFFENRANGQSKGFCVVTLGSENSVRNVIEKLPKNELHGQNPLVTSCNKQNLNHFEMQSRKLTPGFSGNQQMSNHQSGPRPFSGPPGAPSNTSRPPLIPRPQRPNGPLLQSQPRMPLPQSQNSGPFSNNQPPWHPNMQNSNPRGGPPMHQGGPSRGSSMPMLRMQHNNSNTRGPGGPLLRAPGPPNDHRNQHPSQMQEWSDHSHGHMSQPLLQGGVSNNGPLQRSQGPAPHVNPAFFQPNVPQNPGMQSGYLRGPQSGDYSMQDYRGGDHLAQMSEQEYEEIMNKNRNVSSQAISRAVADASAGDFAAAIDTLVTAMSLIKQSKVSNDERCKILVSTLQDTLNGIESKSYSRSGKDRPRSRERSRDRNRRDKPSRRDKSRSRERDYRDRSRDRERYHEERYHEERYREKDRDRDRDRDRERDRERDHRSSRH